MQPRAARLVVACMVVFVFVTVVALAAPRIIGAIHPTAMDSVVPLALLGAAALILRSREWTAALLLASAAGLWSLTGMAGLLGEPLAGAVARLALVPHALVVTVLLLLPYGDLGRWGRTGAVGALALAALAGSGVPLPVLALFGLICLAPGAAGLVWARAPEAIAACLALVLLGFGWMTLWWGTDRVPLRTVADGVDVVLLASAAAVVLVLGRGRAPDELGAELSKRVGAVLGLPITDVRFPLPGVSNVVLDVDGRRSPSRPATEVVADGTVVALVSPPVSLTRGTERAMARWLSPVAEIAALNDSRRRQAAELDESRRRLATAAAEERRRVEQALGRTVLKRLHTIEALLEGSGAAHEELGRVRSELRDLVAGLDPLRGRTLGEALLSWGERVTVVGVAPSLDAPPVAAQTAWWVVAESVSNALKHAPDAAVVIRAERRGNFLEVSVTDDGPGGANPRGSGLLGLADRAAVAGGRLDIESSSGGTSVRVALPTGWPVDVTRSAPDPLVRQGS